MTTLIVQKDRIIHNYNTFSRAVGKASVIPVLAGNAYGLGCVSVATILYNEGVRFIACSRLEDAIKIKRHFGDIEVLLLSTYSSENEASQIVENDIIATVGSYDSGVIISGMAQQLNKNIKVHLKFDTNLARMGFSCDEVQKAVQVAQFLPNIKVCGVYSNISTYDCKNKKRVLASLTKFNTCLSLLKREGIECGLVHIAGTVGSLKYSELRTGVINATRCGSALVGDIEIKDKWGFRKVGRLTSNIADISWVPEKQVIGINNSYKTKRAAKIALVPTGYVDGVGIGITNEPFRRSQLFKKSMVAIGRAFKGRKLFCDINGKKVRVIGRIDLETLIVDVTKITCKPGDIVSFDVDPLFVNDIVKRSYV